MMIGADELARWATAHDVRVRGGPAAAVDDAGARCRGWDLGIDGRLEDIAGLAQRLLARGRLFAIEALSVEPTGDPAISEGRLRGVEWAAGSGAAVARVTAGAWHAEALDITRRVQPLGGGLSLGPSRGVLGGELLAESDRAIAEGLSAPAFVRWDLSGLRPARQPGIALPVVSAASDGAALLALDAVDAPNGALAWLLGARGPAGRGGGRFTGRIDAGRPADARAALGGSDGLTEAVEAALVEAPGSGWRLAATVRDGTTRTALFEAPDGGLHSFADRGEWDDVFLRFERGRVVMPTPSVHVLERRPEGSGQ